MPEDKLPIPQFAAKIKAKYPEYKDMDDTLLVNKIVAKYPEYGNSVDMGNSQPPVKKKEYSGLFGGVRKAVDESNSNPQSLSQEKSQGFQAGSIFGQRKQKPSQAQKNKRVAEKINPPENNPFGIITDENSFTPDVLDSQERKEYDQYSHKVTQGHDAQLVKDIVRSRGDSQVMKQRAANYIQEDVMNDPEIHNYTHQDGSIDFPNYFQSRQSKLLEKIDELDEQLSNTDIPLKQQQLTNEINDLGRKIKETQRYANVANEDYAIKNTDPNSPTYERDLGINLSKVNDYKGATKKLYKIENGEDALRSKEVTEKEDFDYTLAGLNALKNKTIELFNTGQISKEDAEAKMLDLLKKDVALEKKYPIAKLNNVRNWLGEYIANNRKGTKTGVGETIQNVFYAEPSKEEVQDALKKLKGVDLSETEIQELIRDKDKIPLTSVVGHAYKSSILKMAQSFNRFTMDENEAEKVNYERGLGFQDPSMYQAEQPFELPEVQKVSDDVKAVRNATNPNAGKHAGLMSWATANSVGDVAGTIASYAMGNRVGGAIGMENLGANITTSAFLNYHDNLDAAKQITDNKAEQNFIASIKSTITGLIFGGITPVKLPKGAEQTGVKQLSEMFKDGNLNPATWQSKLADIVVKTGKDLGKNISLMDADKIASFTIDAIANKESVRNRDLGKEMLDELPSQLVSLGAFSAFHGTKAAKVEAKERTKAIETLRMATADVPAFERGMAKEVEQGKISETDAKKEVDFVKGIAEKMASKDLNTKRMLDVSPEKRLQYAVNLGREQEIKDGIKDMSDDLQIAHEKEKIAELQNERQQTLIEDISDEELYNELKAKAGAGTKATLQYSEMKDGLMYLKDKAAESPIAFKKEFGEALGNKVLETVGKTRIKDNIKFLEEKNSKDENIPILKKMLSEIESKEVAKGTPEETSQPIELSVEDNTSEKEGGVGVGGDVESTTNVLNETQKSNPTVWQKIKDAFNNVVGKVKEGIKNTQDYLKQSVGTQYEELGKALQPYLAKIETEIHDKLKDQWGIGTWGGLFENGKIKIGKNEDLQTFFHEALHSVTSSKIKILEAFDLYNKVLKEGGMPEKTLQEMGMNLSENDITAIRNLQRIFEESKVKLAAKKIKVTGKHGYYGFNNVHEFISEAFTNPEFQRLLKELPSEGNHPTIFKAFLDAIAKLIGIKDPTILEDIFHHTEKLLDKPKSENESIADLYHQSKKNNTNHDFVKAVEQSLKESQAGSGGVGVGGDVEFTAKGGNKVVDEKGEPLVVYHGTKAEFDEFDKNKRGTNTDNGLFGKGFYFTKNEKTAQSYGEKVKNIYLSIKNPFRINDFKTKSEMAKHLGVDESILREGGTGIGVYNEFSGVFSDALKEKGYDGVITKYGEYVVFDKSQIKAVEQSLKETPQEGSGGVGGEVIEKKNTGTEIEPDLGEGRRVVTLSGSTEAERQVAIENRKKETKQTPMTSDRDTLLERIQKYNKLSRVEKRTAYNEVNKIKIALDTFNKTHDQSHSITTNRDGTLDLRNNPTEKRASGKPIKYTLKGNENSIVDNGKPLMERDSNTKQVFNDLLDANVLPISRRINGEKMSDAEHDATIQDIMDGIPSQRAENYLNSLEKQIKEDNFDYGNPDKNAAAVTLKDALGITVEEGEQMTPEKIEKWLNDESELTPEQEILFDNIDNLITHYEQLHESGNAGTLQQPNSKGKESDSGKGNKDGKPKSEDSGDNSNQKINETKEEAQEPIIPTNEGGNKGNELDTPKTGSNTNTDAPKKTEDTGGSKPPPTTPPKGEGVEGQGEVVSITHEQTNEVAKELGLPEYEVSPETVKEWDAEVDKRIQSDPNAIKDMLKRYRNREKIDKYDQRMMLKYFASLKAKFNKSPNGETLKKIAEAKRLSDIEGGREVAKSLVARKGFTEVKEIDDFANFVLEEANANQVETLPQRTIDELKTKYDADQKVIADLNLRIEKLEKEAADREFDKQVKKTKKVNKDFKAERQSLKDKLKQQYSDYKAAGQKMGIAADGGAESFKISVDMAKTIGEYVKTYLAEGVTKLSDVVSKIYEEIKDVMPDIKERDIRDVIAGKYAEKKQTKSEIAIQMRDIKMQQIALDKIEKLEKGEAIEKNPIKKQKISEELEKLRNKIAELKSADKKTPEEVALQSYKTGLKNKIDKLKKDLETGDYLKDPEPKKPLKLDAEAQKLQDEHIKFVKETNIRRAKAEYANRSRAERWYDNVLQVLGIKRIVQTAIDLSIPLRQGVTLAFNPRRWDTFGKSFKAMLKSTFSPKTFDRYMYNIHQSPEYKDMLKDKVHFNEMDAVDSNSRNEDFQKSFIYKIPVLREPLLASNRAADGFLNVSRFDMYLKGKRMLERQGITRENSPESYEALGKWVMNITGRGNLLKFIEDSHNGRMVASNTFFGARLMASRFNLLNPIYYAKMPSAVRKEAMKDMATFTGMLIATGLAAKAAGASISFDPDDSDFLKLKFGNTKYDISGGMVQYVRTYLRLQKAVTMRFNPNVSKAEADKYAKYAMKSTGDFFRYKLAPNTSYGLSAITGKDALGRDFDPAEAAKIYPMYVDDMIAGYKEQGLTSLLTILTPSLLGVGVQTYEDGKDYSDEQLKTPELKFISDKGLELPKAGYKKQYNINVVKDKEHPDGEITEDEFQDFKKERAKIIIEETKSISEEEKRVTKEDADGKRISSEKIKVKDMDAEDLKKVLSDIAEEATKKAKEIIIEKYNLKLDKSKTKVD